MGFPPLSSCSADSGQRGFSTSPAGKTRRGEWARVAGTNFVQGRIKSIVMRNIYYNRITEKRQSICRNTFKKPVISSKDGGCFKAKSNQNNINSPMEGKSYKGSEI